MTSGFIVIVLKCRDVNNLTTTTHMNKARLTYWYTIRGPYTKMQYLLTLIHDKNTCDRLEIGMTQMLIDIP